MTNEFMPLGAVKKVYENTLMNGSIKCTFYLMQDGNYLRVQEYPSVIMEQDCTPEEFEQFLLSVERFNNLTKDKK